jgi:glutaredoxin-like protein NrdH
MSVEEKLKFTVQEGKDSRHDLTVYALSTCGYCKRALAYLQEKSLAFRYVYIDLLPPDVKTELKDELKEKFQRTLLFPFLVVDGKEATAGFDQEKWNDLLK